MTLNQTVKGKFPSWCQTTVSQKWRQFTVQCLLVMTWISRSTCLALAVQSATSQYDEKQAKLCYTASFITAHNWHRVMMLSSCLSTPSTVHSIDVLQYWATEMTCKLTVLSSVLSLPFAVFSPSSCAGNNHAYNLHSVTDKWLSIRFFLFHHLRSTSTKMQCYTDNRMGQTQKAVEEIHPYFPIISNPRWVKEDVMVKRHTELKITRKLVKLPRLSQNRGQ